MVHIAVRSTDVDRIMSSLELKGGCPPPETH
jgi:hypothetical protein